MSAIMSFGMFVFSIPTLLHEEMQRSADYRFARNARIGARDAAQFIGPGDETVSLSGTAYSEMGDIEGSMQDLAAIANEGTALPLVCANGTVYGTFVLTRIDQRGKAFWPDGSPRALSFTLDLLRVDDTETGTKTAAADAGQWV
ncbi:MAG: phage tail protein [Sphingobium sp.]